MTVFKNINRRIFAIVAGALSLLIIAGWFAVDRLLPAVDQNHKNDTAVFVGSGACVNCHQQQARDWKTSDHHRAMETANQQTVLGNFNNAEFSYFGRKTTFSKQGDIFLVNTENQQGKLETFTVLYTLGYRPLQQYLVKFSDGRIQTLPFAWDTRKKEEGGQRWFHLYPDENITSDNPLFWTRPLQNWNHMCADCHTTNYSKNFSDKTNSFDSHWTEMSNGCESCHGAGSEHINRPDKPFLINKVARQVEQIDSCGVCHARREKLSYTQPEKIMQTWQPDLLHDPLYFSDGQIRDEVFEIGSFMQSKMYAAGVTCTNCHDPHTTKLKIEGNGLCTQCHVKETYDTDSHHFHAEKTEGAQCVSCHMPARTYMIVNPRHDHRFSIPRPDLSEKISAPNACVDCHKTKHKQQGKNNEWAAKQIKKHLEKSGKITTRPEHFGEVLWATRHEQIDASEMLYRMLREEKYNPLVRASALSEYAGNLDPGSLQLIEVQLKNPDALIRLGAVQALYGVAPEQRNRILIAMLNDESRAVRLAVVGLIAGIDKTSLTAMQQAQLENCYAEYVDSLQLDSDRGPALVALASHYMALGDTQTAETYFKKALQRDDKSLSAYLNYADYFRSAGNDGEAEKLLRTALEIYPDSADAHYAYGLLLVRNRQQSIALPQLKQAMQLAPDNSHYAYVYGVGLYSVGQQNQGMEILAQAHSRFPANARILSALTSYYTERGDMTRAQKYGEKLHQLTRQPSRE